MKFVENCNRDRFDEFVVHHSYNHYMKTSFWADHKAREGFIPHFVTLEEEDQIVASALILEKKNSFVMASYYYIPWGYCIDYHNEELVRYFTLKIKEMALKNKVMFIRMDPNVLRCQRDIKGNRIEGGVDNEKVTSILTQCGFTHFGYKYAYSGTWVNRYTLVIDLHDDMNTIIKRFNKTRQNILKRHKQLNVQTRVGTKEDIRYLCEFEKQLTETQGFKPHTPDFFEQIVDDLKEHAVIYVTECNLKEICDYLDTEINSKKYAKDLAAKQSKEKELKEYQSLYEKFGEHAVLAAGLFVRFNEKSWDLYTYKNTNFLYLKGIDSMHTFAIEDMKNHGVTFYDMCGFSGVADPSDAYYGLYSYKSSFGSEFYEQLGQFDMILNETKSNLYFKGLHNVNRVKRKLARMKYLKKTTE